MGTDRWKCYVCDDHELIAARDEIERLKGFANILKDENGELLDDRHRAADLVSALDDEVMQLKAEIERLQDTLNKTLEFIDDGT